MTAAGVGVDTAILRLRVTVRDTPTRKPPAEFGFQFQQIESLLFVSALLAGLDLERQRDPLQAETVFPRSTVTESQMYSGEFVAAAITIAKAFVVEEVTYQSPMEVVLAAYESWVNAGPYVIVPAWAAVTAHHAVLLWKSFHSGRLGRAEADLAEAQARKAEIDLDYYRQHAEGDARTSEATARTAEANARSAEADARIKEAEARVKEAEALTKIEAQNIIRSRLGVVQNLHASTSMMNRAGPPDPSTTPQALAQRLDEAADALVAIDNMRIDERPSQT